MAKELSGRVAWALNKAVKKAAGKETRREGMAEFIRRDPDGTAWVKLVGSDVETPVNGTMLANAVPGQMVSYNLEGTQLSVMGNASEPAVGQESVDRTVEPVDKKADAALAEAKRAHEAADAAEADAARAATAAESAETSATTAATAASNAETSAETAATAATSASGSATQAAADAAMAATQATNAAGSASQAATSASNAATSASNAESSASSAAADAAQAASDASSAASSATSAQNSATSAASSATSAQNSATQAVADAGAAAQSAAQAASDASAAAGSASQAATQAGNAATSASQAATSASNAASSAATASSQASAATTAANEAKEQATSANKSATEALTQLSFVEDVAGVLDWIQSHGTFIATSDTSVAEGKVYFELVQGDYVPIASPDEDANPHTEGWYELDTMTAQSDYIMSHLAVTSAGLWVLPSGIGSAQSPSQANGWKLLLANDRAVIYDDTGTAVTTMGSDITFDAGRPQRIGNSTAYVEFSPTGGGTINIVGSNVYTKTQTDTLMNSIQVGGRNLALNTKAMGKGGVKTNRYVYAYNGATTVYDYKDGFSAAHTGKANWRGLAVYLNSMGFKVGDKVTASAIADATGSLILSWYLMCYNSENTRVYPANTVNSGDVKTVTSNGTYRIEATFEWTQGCQDLVDAGGHIQFTFQSRNSAETGDDTYFYAFKLERGTRATDWTPAPEDTEERLTSAETSISQNAEQIELRATKTEVTQNISAAISTTARRNYFRLSGLADRSGFVANSSTDFTKYLRYYNGNAAKHTFTAVGDGTYQDTVALDATGNLGIAFGRLASEFDLDPNEWYTASCWAKCTKSGARLSFGTSYRSTSDTWQWYGGQYPVAFEAVNTWQFFEWKFKPNAATKAICYCFTSADGVTGGTDTLTIKHCKLEKGEEATDWIPAYEDIDSRVTVAESSITQNATNINLKVSKNDVINQINISDEDITIDADRVNIAGAAIFTNGRLSETSLNNTYDANGAAATAKQEAIEAAAQDATDKADAAQTAATNAANSATDTKLESYSTTQQMNAAIGDAVDDIEIGGRNLFAVSQCQTGYLAVTSGTNISPGDFVSTPAYTDQLSTGFIPVTPGETFVVQMWNPLKLNETSHTNRILWYTSNKTYISNAIPHNMRPDGSEYWCATVTAPTNAAYVRFGFIMGLASQYRSEVKVKVERGNKPTEWSLAPEDVQAATRPNLHAYFEHDLGDVYSASTNPEGYWTNDDPPNNVISSTWATPLENGWIHIERTNSGSSTVNSLFRPLNNGLVKDDATYTVLVELRNITAMPTTLTMYTQQSSTSQVWGSNGYGGFNIANERFSLNDADYQAHWMAVSTIGKSAHSTNDTTFLHINWQIPAGGSINCDLRVSVYEGYYLGSWKPHYTNPSAVKKTQLVYKSAANGTVSMPAPTSIVLDATGAQATWTTKRPQYSQSYPVLFVATQSKTEAGKLSCTTPHIDDTTTVIDGGHIITNTVTAEKINANSINASGMLTVGSLDSSVKSNISEMYDYTVDLTASTYDQDTWYPVIITPNNSKPLHLLMEFRGKATNATWCTHQQKKWTAYIDLYYVGSAWGWASDNVSYFNEYSFSQVSGRPVAFTNELNHGSNLVMYLRGGESYPFKMSSTNSPSVKTASYTEGSQTVAPTTTQPSNTSNFSTSRREAQNAINASAKRTHRIYKQTNSTTAPTTPGTGATQWVSDETGDPNTWTCKRMSYSSDYPYIWTCEQTEASNGTMSYTTVLLDDTTTVIDGGKIITGSVTANQIAANTITATELDADSVKADIIQTTELDAAQITSGTIDADRINASSLVIGSSTLGNTLDGKASNDTVNELKGSVFWEGTCDTAAATAAKVVTCPGFTSANLVNGARIRVRFTTANTLESAITMNVNNTGAKSVFAGANTSTTNFLFWAAGGDISFVYTGTLWKVVDAPGTYYSTCGTAAATAAKTTSVDSAVIFKGTTVCLQMTEENTSTSATLNVESTKARAIYYGSTATRPTTENGYGWKAGSTATFVFDGQFWRYQEASLVSDTRDAAKRTDVSIAVTVIDYSAGTATLQATLYIDGVATTSNVTYAWLKDGTTISGETSRTLSVTAAMGLSHVYSCTVTY